MDWTDWRVASLSEAFKLQSKSQAAILLERSKPSPLVQIEIVRRSWLTPGEVVVATQMTSIKKQSRSHGTWSLKLIAPEQTGTYRVRVSYGQRHLGDRTPISSPHRVAVFNMTVDE